MHDRLLIIVVFTVIGLLVVSSVILALHGKPYEALVALCGSLIAIIAPSALGGKKD